MTVYQLAHNIGSECGEVIDDHLVANIGAEWHTHAIPYDGETNRVDIDDLNLIMQRYVDQGLTDEEYQEAVEDDIQNGASGLTYLYRVNSKTLWCIYKGIKDGITDHKEYFKDIYERPTKYMNFRTALFEALKDVLFIYEPNHEKIIYHVIDSSFEKLKDKLK